jgi:predicted nucleic acid-binding protein
METLVLDCSVTAKWVLHEAGHAEALRLLQEEKSGQVSLIAPDLLLMEFASLIAKRVRRLQIPAAQAADTFRLLRQVAPVLFDTRPLLDAALQLALHRHVSLWDSVYLALAIQHNCPLITADRRLFRYSKSRLPAIRLLKYDTKET